MTIEKVNQVLDSVLGPSFTDTGDDGEPRINRTFVADVMMDYLTNNRDRQFVIQSLQSIIGEKMSILELCAMIEEIDCLRETNE